MDDNKKALVYLGIAVVLVFGWLMINKQLVGEGMRDQKEPAQEEVKTPEIKNTEPDMSGEPDGKGGLTTQENGNTRLKKWTAFANTSLGFSVNLPAGWYAPDPNDSDPHFFSCGSYECPMAFEVQRTDTLADKGFKQVMEEAKGDQLRPREIWLIKGARVIKSDAPEAASGWSDQYLVIFEKEHRAYTMFVNGWQTERSILTTFKLLK